MSHTTHTNPHDDFDPELIGDFRDEFQDAFDTIQGILVMLGQAQDRHEHLHALFRALHSIKSNLRMMQLNTLSEFVHVMENILDDMREDRLAYDNRFSDIILLSLEQVREAFTAMFAGADSEAVPLQTLQALLENIHRDHANAMGHFTAALRHLDPLAVDTKQDAQDQRACDLEFFASLSAFVERRLAYEPGTTGRLLGMAEQMNALAGHPIDERQLRAAIYMHDFGMAFVSAELLHRQAELNAEEKRKLQRHAGLAADLLAHSQIWDEASAIVRQHHERVDGEGYPHRLRGEQLCAGARLLAIVDTFEAMTQRRGYREQRRAVLRVVAEINAQAGKQFDPFWVEVFNKWVRQVYIKSC